MFLLVLGFVVLACVGLLVLDSEEMSERVVHVCLSALCSLAVVWGLFVRHIMQW